MAKRPDRNSPVETDLDTPGSDEAPAGRDTRKRLGTYDSRYGSTEDIYDKVERQAKTYRK